jgi:DNA-binding MarR family transcriptional regulator
LWQNTIQGCPALEKETETRCAAEAYANRPQPGGVEAMTIEHLALIGNMTINEATENVERLKAKGLIAEEPDEILRLTPLGFEVEEEVSERQPELRRMVHYAKEDFRTGRTN